jgi:hypothetical protein
MSTVVPLLTPEQHARLPEGALELAMNGIAPVPRSLEANG